MYLLSHPLMVMPRETLVNSKKSLAQIKDMPYKPKAIVATLHEQAGEMIKA